LIPDSRGIHAGFASPAGKTAPKQAVASAPAVGGAQRTDPARHGSMARRK